MIRTPTLTTITAKDSTEFWIRTNPSGLDIVAAFPTADQGKVHGLVGPFTGRTGRQQATGADLCGKDDPHRAISTDYTTLYRTFADSWRITQADSLFTDEPGTDATAFNDPTFPDRTAPAIPADRGGGGQGRLPGRRPDRGRPRGLRIRRRPHRRCRLSPAAAAAAGRRARAAPTTGVRRASGPGPSAATSFPARPCQARCAANSKTTYDFTVPAGTVGYFAADPGAQQDDDVVSGTSRTPQGQLVMRSSVICSDLGRVVFPAAGDYRVVVTNSGTTAESSRSPGRCRGRIMVKPLQAGQTATGTIDKPGAQDVWTMTVAAGTVAYLAADPSCVVRRRVRDPVEPRWMPTGSPVIGGSYICSDLGRVVFDKAGTYRS